MRIRGQNLTGRAFRNVGRGLNRLRAQTVSLNGSLGTLAATLGAGAAFGRALTNSRELESTFARIQGLVGLSKQEVDELRASLGGISAETARGPNELAEALFFITSAGARGQEALEILTASAKAASAGLGETEVVADAVTSAVNAFGAENLSASRATGILVAAVREGKLSADSLAGSLPNVVSTAKAVGVEFDEVAAAIAAASRTGSSAEESVTQLTAVFTALLKPTSDGEKALARFGLSFEDLRKILREQGLLTLLKTLGSTVGQNQAEFVKVIPNVRALRLSLNLLGQDSETVEGIFERLGDETGQSLDKAFNTAADTAEFRLNQQLARLDSILIRLGDSSLPAVVTLLEKVADLSAGLQIVFTGQGDNAIVNLDNQINKIDRDIQNLIASRESLFSAQLFDGEFLIGDEAINQQIELLQKLREELLEEQRKLLGLGPTTGGGGGGGADEEEEEAEDDGEEVDEEAEKEAERRRKRLAQLIQSQNEEAEALGKTRTEVTLLKAARLGATEAQLREIELAGKAVEQFELDAKNREELENILQEQAEERKRREEEENERLENQAEAVRNLIDPFRELNQELANLQVLLDAGKINQEEFELATENVNERIDELGEKLAKESNNLSTFAVEGLKRVQSQFADLLFDPFAEGTDGMLRGFVDVIRRMAAEAAAARIFESLFGSDANGFQGGAASGFLSFISGLFHSGGFPGQTPNSFKSVNPFAFVGAQRFQTGGFPGIGPNEVPIIADRGEEVLSADDPRNALNGGLNGGRTTGGPIRIVLVDDMRKVGDFINSVEGEELIIKQVQRNREAILS